MRRLMLGTRRKMGALDGEQPFTETPIEKRCFELNSGVSVRGVEGMTSTEKEAQGVGMYACRGCVCTQGVF